MPPTLTLTAAMGADPAADTTVALSGNYNPPNGTVIQVGAERMYVNSGSGTNTLNVDRAQVNGGPIATHNSGDTVTIPGGFTWTLIPFSVVANQEFIFVKGWWTTDINYIKIIPVPKDPGAISVNELPDGEPYHILGDISSAHGVFQFKVPQV
jgi:hypothetical protein